MIENKKGRNLKCKSRREKRNLEMLLLLKEEKKVESRGGIWAPFIFELRHQGGRTSASASDKTCT
jgi:hypothetical protein